MPGNEAKEGDITQSSLVPNLVVSYSWGGGLNCPALLLLREFM